LTILNPAERPGFSLAADRSVAGLQRFRNDQIQADVSKILQSFHGFGRLTLGLDWGRKIDLQGCFDRAVKPLIFHQFSGQRIWRRGFSPTLPGLIRPSQKKDSGETAAPLRKENLKFHSQLQAGPPCPDEGLRSPTRLGRATYMLLPFESALYGLFIAGRTAMAAGDFRKIIRFLARDRGVGGCSSLSCCAEMKCGVVLRRAFLA
jgi:hypothetical protein